MRNNYERRRLKKMSDTKPTLDQRLSALENQAYIMYLQLNAVTKLLLDKDILTQDEITSEMDTLNEEIQKMTKEMVEGSAEEAAETQEEN